MKKLQMPKKSEKSGPGLSVVQERFSGIFLAQWEELLRLRRVVLKSSGLDDIHDLRVASRRFRAVLDLYCRLSSKCVEQGMIKNVRKLTRTLGFLRNLDEAGVFFQARIVTEVFSESILKRSLSGVRSRELRRMGKALSSFEHRKLDRIVRKIVAKIRLDRITERNDPSIPAFFSEISASMYWPVQEALAVSTVSGHRAERHALRIAIKKWRYFLEIVAQVLNRDCSRILEQLKEYQSFLGRMNDIVEFEALLRDMDLPKNESDNAEAILAAEDAKLLAGFRELVERNPLMHYDLLNSE